MMMRFTDWLLDTGWGIFLLCVVIVVGFTWGANALVGASCERTAGLYELEYDYSFMTGCNVLVDGEYRNIENVRVFLED